MNFFKVIVLYYFTFLAEICESSKVGYILTNLILAIIVYVKCGLM